QKLDPLPHAAARRHANQGEGGLRPKVPAVFFVGDDRHELARPVLRRLPALDVTLGDPACGPEDRYRPKRDDQRAAAQPPSPRIPGGPRPSALPLRSAHLGTELYAVSRLRPKVIRRSAAPAPAPSRYLTTGRAVL